MLVICMSPSSNYLLSIILFVTTVSVVLTTTTNNNDSSSINTTRYHEDRNYDRSRHNRNQLIESHRNDNNIVGRHASRSFPPRNNNTSTRILPSPFRGGGNETSGRNHGDDASSVTTVFGAAIKTTTTTTPHRRRQSSSILEGIQLSRTTYKLPRSIERNFIDWDDTIEQNPIIITNDENEFTAHYHHRPIPIFWHILKSGGTTMKLLYAQCYHLVEACETGALIEMNQQQRQQKIHEQTQMQNKEYPLLQQYQQQLQQQEEEETQQLRIVTSEDGRKYMNVDVTTSEGIQRASQLGLTSSPLVDVIFTPLVLESAEYLFSNIPITIEKTKAMPVTTTIRNRNNNNNNNNNNTIIGSMNSRKGQMFALFRHPIQRVTSIFYYLQNATWEPTYNPQYAHWTLHDYAVSSYCESNWMVRTLVQKMTGPVGRKDLLVAQEILQRKCLVGLLEEMEESVRRFHYWYFRPYHPTTWIEETKEDEENVSLNCAMKHFAAKGLSGQNSHDHPVLDETSETWDILATKNRLDIQLYDFAKQFFVEQGKWMKEQKKQGQTS